MRSKYDDISLNPRDGRRLVRVGVAPGLVGNMMTGLLAFTESDVPADATVAWSYYDGVRNLFTVVFEHPSFKPLGYNDMIPMARGPMISKPDCASLIKDAYRYLEDCLSDEESARLIRRFLDVLEMKR